MPYRPKRAKKSEPKSGAEASGQSRSNQLSDQRHREMAVRSTLSRLRHRKSPLK
jgi:hypothetical protein